MGIQFRKSKFEPHKNSHTLFISLSSKVSKEPSTMKFLAGSISLFAISTNANYASMQAHLQKLYNDTARTQGNRNVAAMMGPSLTVINGYGCWCYFDDDSYGKGKGKPVAEVDAYCKTLMEGYECARLDSEEENADEPCIPWEVDYATGAQGNLDAIVSDCALRNVDDNCAIRACIVEGWFVNNIFQAFFGGFAIDTSLQHDNGFSVKDQCPTNQGMKSEKSCCGVYPYRHSYKTYGGGRACCGSKTYDVSISTCCADGKPRLSCL